MTFPNTCPVEVSQRRGSALHRHLAKTTPRVVSGTPTSSHVHELSRAVASGGTGRVLQAVPPADRDKVVHVAHQRDRVKASHERVVSVAVAALGSVAGYALVRSRDFVAGGASFGTPRSVSPTNCSRPDPPN